MQMKIDEPDNELRGLLEEAASSIHPYPERYLSTVRRHGTRLWAMQWIAIAVGITSFIGAVVYAASLELSSSERTTALTAPVSNTWSTYRDTDFAWTLEYPSSWQLS